MRRGAVFTLVRLLGSGQTLPEDGEERVVQRGAVGQFVLEAEERG